MDLKRPGRVADPLTFVAATWVERRAGDASAGGDWKS
jgi:hypothetical protein